MVFSSTILIILGEGNGTVYYGALDIPKLKISLGQARDCLRMIPEEEVYPLLPPDLAPFDSRSISPDEYIKRPKFLSYRWSAGSKIVAARFLDEALTLNIVRRNPHRNVVTFQGYLIENGRIIGLALQNYSSTLSGVEYLHKLGLAHNDLSPSNIMLGEDDCPVIIDLGSCKPFGEDLSEAGTPHLNDGFDEVSTPNNDEAGLRKLRDWLGLSEETRRLAEPFQHIQ